MAQDELTNNRPSNYSTWHRNKLPLWCCQADADWYEVRQSNVVAIVETMQIKPDNFELAGEWLKTDPWLKKNYADDDLRYPPWKTKRVVLNFHIGASRKPIYIVYHTPDMSRVRVINYRTKAIKEFNEKQYQEWLQSIR